MMFLSLNSNTTDANRGVGTAYPSAEPEITIGF